MTEQKIPTYKEHLNEGKNWKALMYDAAQQHKLIVNDLGECVFDDVIEQAFSAPNFKGKYPKRKEIEKYLLELAKDAIDGTLDPDWDEKI